MRIGSAIECLEKGMRVTRLAWNGNQLPEKPQPLTENYITRGYEPRMWLFYVSPQDYMVIANAPAMDPSKSVRTPWIALRTVDDKIVPWTCHQTDLLANDWVGVL